MTKTKTKTVALYLRVSTGDQTVENQRRELLAAISLPGNYAANVTKVPYPQAQEPGR